MKVLLAAPALLLLLLLLGTCAAHPHDDTTTRDGKLIVVVINPSTCTTNDATETVGTCTPYKNCLGLSNKSGICAKGLGTCCRVTRTCSGSTTYNNTYFQSPSYSSTDTGTGTCSLTVNRANNNICQVRLDFVDFELGQPNEEGVCVDDFLTVVGGTSTVPTICGSNTGQHMYIDVDPAGGALQLNVDRSTASSAAASRRWNINVKQIECDSPDRAPTGCLQYYRDTRATVSSFNFANTPVSTTTYPTRQLANQNYGICVEQAAGYCGITWSQAAGSTNAFTVSGSTDGIDPTLIGTAAGGTSGAACTADYVLIPGAPEDRYCGLGLVDTTPVTSSLSPFRLFYVTDVGETVASGTASNDQGNMGFSLDYQQTTTC